MPTLNEHHCRVIVTGFQSIDRQLAELEPFLAEGGAASPFSPYVKDLSPTEIKVVRDYFARIRTVMQAGLHELDIPLDVRRISLRWALQAGMSFLNVSVAEIGPNKLIGYGSLAPEGRDQVVTLQNDLERTINRLGAYLRQRTGRDLPQRLQRLEAALPGNPPLALLDRVIGRWQLVEFLPLLDTLIERLEKPEFEIAVFGRVSSGKSSLLNHLAGAEVLPVGVTPVTSVPTRLARGDKSAALITFAEVEPRRVGLDRLGEYASEDGNPGNHKHVTSILVELPSPRLREGVVFVDTPGTGSLAVAGNMETLAYLPHCDLGVVLIDAGSTLNEDDLRILRSLYEAGTPVQVVLSKADLLSLADRQRMLDYIREQLRKELEADIPVRPVSTVGEDETLLATWFDAEIMPLLDRHRELRQTSLRRKAAVLYESVVSVLETMLARRNGESTKGLGTAETDQAKELLDRASAAIQRTKTRMQQWTADQPALVESIMSHFIQAVISRPERAPPSVGAAVATVHPALQDRSAVAYELIAGLQHTLAHVLESLRRAMPRKLDIQAVNDFKPRGLPAPELSSLHEPQAEREPAWAIFFPGLATRQRRRAMEQRFKASIREHVENHDRQLHSWLAASAVALVELYESQAEIAREQVRRSVLGDNDLREARDTCELEQDLETLRAEAVKAEQPANRISEA